MPPWMSPTAIVSVLIADVGWYLAHFVGRPIRKFYDLRAEIIRKLTERSDQRNHDRMVRLVPAKDERGIRDIEHPQDAAILRERKCGHSSITNPFQSG